jgi:hypothetical protein
MRYCSSKLKRLVPRYCWRWIAVAVLLGIIGLVINRGRSSPKPLVFQSDIGEFVPFEATERAIIIENPGRRFITINEVRPCCGVFLPYGFPKTIHPQSSAAMVVRVSCFDSAIEKAIKLITDDPVHPVAECVIRGKPDFSAPYAIKTIKLGKIVPGQTFPLVWGILKGNGPDLKCSVISSSMYITAFVQEADQHGNVGVDISVSKDAPRGTLVAHLFATTGVQARPTFSARLEAEVERGLRARPENVFFGVVKDEAVVSKRIGLEVLEPGWDKVEVDRPSDECLEVQTVQTGPSKYELHVSLNPEKMPKILNTVLTLRDSSGDSLQIRVIAVQSTSTKTMAVAAK